MAREADIRIDKNGKLEYTIQLVGPADLAGWTAKLQVRERRNPTSPLFAEWSSAGGEIAVLSVDLQIQIDVSASVTNGYTWAAGFYDLIATLPDDVTTYRLLQGRVYVSSNVTV